MGIVRIVEPSTIGDFYDFGSILGAGGFTPLPAHGGSSDDAAAGSRTFSVLRCARAETGAI